MTPNIRGSAFMVASMAAFALEDALIKQAASGMPVGQIMLFIGLFGLAAFSLQSLRARAAPPAARADHPRYGHPFGV